MSKIFPMYLWGNEKPRARENNNAFVAVHTVFVQSFCRCIAVLYVVFAYGIKLVMSSGLNFSHMLL